MERFEIIEETSMLEIEFQNLCQSKTYAVFDLDQFFIYFHERKSATHYKKGCLYSLTGDKNINIDLLSNIEQEGTHFVAEFESIDGALDFFNTWKKGNI
jgi:hypothetical protein